MNEVDKMLIDVRNIASVKTARIEHILCSVDGKFRYTIATKILTLELKNIPLSDFCFDFPNSCKAPQPIELKFRVNLPLDPGMI